jgi:hypothetical protein
MARLRGMGARRSARVGRVRQRHGRTQDQNDGEEQAHVALQRWWMPSTEVGDAGAAPNGDKH